MPKISTTSGKVEKIHSKVEMFAERHKTDIKCKSDSNQVLIITLNNVNSLIVFFFKMVFVGLNAGWTFHLSINNGQL